MFLATVKKQKYKCYPWETLVCTGLIFVWIKTCGLHIHGISGAQKPLNLYSWSIFTFRSNFGRSKLSFVGYMEIHHGKNIGSLRELYNTWNCEVWINC